MQKMYWFQVNLCLIAVALLTQCFVSAANVKDSFHNNEGTSLPLLKKVNPTNVTVIKENAQHAARIPRQSSAYNSNNNIDTNTDYKMALGHIQDVQESSASNKVLLVLNNDKNKYAEESSKRMTRNPDAMDDLVGQFQQLGDGILQQVSQTAPDISKSFGQALNEALTQTNFLAQVPPPSFNLSQMGQNLNESTLPGSLDLNQLGQSLSQNFLVGATQNLFNPNGVGSAIDAESKMESRTVGTARSPIDKDTNAVTASQDRKNAFDSIVGLPLLPQFPHLPKLSHKNPFGMFAHFPAFAPPLSPLESEISEVRVLPGQYSPYKVSPKEVDHQTMAELNFRVMLKNALKKKTIPILWFHVPANKNTQKSIEDLRMEAKLQIFEEQVIDELKQLQGLAKMANELKTIQLQSGVPSTTSLTTKLNLFEIPIYEITLGDIERTLNDDHVSMLMNTLLQKQHEEFQRHQQATTIYLTDLTGTPIKRQVKGGEDVLNFTEKDDMLKMMTYAYRMAFLNGYEKPSTKTEKVMTGTDNDYMNTPMSQQIQQLQQTFKDVSAPMNDEKKWLEDKQQMSIKAAQQKIAQNPLTMERQITPPYHTPQQQEEIKHALLSHYPNPYTDPKDIPTEHRQLPSDMQEEKILFQTHMIPLEQPRPMPQHPTMTAFYVQQQEMPNPMEIQQQQQQWSMESEQQPMIQIQWMQPPNAQPFQRQMPEMNTNTKENPKQLHNSKMSGETMGVTTAKVPTSDPTLTMGNSDQMPQQEEQIKSEHAQNTAMKDMQQTPIERQMIVLPSHLQYPQQQEKYRDEFLVHHPTYWIHSADLPLQHREQIPGISEEQFHFETYMRPFAPPQPIPGRNRDLLHFHMRRPRPTMPTESYQQQPILMETYQQREIPMKKQQQQWSMEREQRPLMQMQWMQPPNGQQFQRQMPEMSTTTKENPEQQHNSHILPIQHTELPLDMLEEQFNFQRHMIPFQPQRPMPQRYRDLPHFQMRTPQPRTTSFNLQQQDMPTERNQQQQIPMEGQQQQQWSMEREQQMPEMSTTTKENLEQLHNSTMSGQTMNVTTAKTPSSDTTTAIPNSDQVPQQQQQMKIEPTESTTTKDMQTSNMPIIEEDKLQMVENEDKARTKDKEHWFGKLGFGGHYKQKKTNPTQEPVVHNYYYNVGGHPSPSTYSPAGSLIPLHQPSYRHYGGYYGNLLPAYRSATGDEEIARMLQQEQQQQLMPKMIMPLVPQEVIATENNSEDRIRNHTKRLAKKETESPAAYMIVVRNNSIKSGRSRTKRSSEYTTLEPIDEKSLHALRKVYKNSLKEITLNPNETPAEALQRYNDESIREALEKANKQHMEIEAAEADVADVQENKSPANNAVQHEQQQEISKQLPSLTENYQFELVKTDAETPAGNTPYTILPSAMQQAVMYEPVANHESIYSNMIPKHNTPVLYNDNNKFITQNPILAIYNPYEALPFIDEYSVIKQPYHMAEGKEKPSKLFAYQKFDTLPTQLSYNDLLTTSTNDMRKYPPPFYPFNHHVKDYNDFVRELTTSTAEQNTFTPTNAYKHIRQPSIELIDSNRFGRFQEFSSATLENIIAVVKEQLTQCCNRCKSDILQRLDETLQHQLHYGSDGQRQLLTKSLQPYNSFTHRPHNIIYDKTSEDVDHEYNEWLRVMANKGQQQRDYLKHVKLNSHMEDKGDLSHEVEKIFLKNNPSHKRAAAAISQTEVKPDEEVEVVTVSIDNAHKSDSLADDEGDEQLVAEAEDEAEVEKDKETNNVHKPKESNKIQQNREANNTFAVIGKANTRSEENLQNINTNKTVEAAESTTNSVYALRGQFRSPQKGQQPIALTLRHAKQFNNYKNINKLGGKANTIAQSNDKADMEEKTDKLEKIIFMLNDLRKHKREKEEEIGVKKNFFTMVSSSATSPPSINITASSAPNVISKTTNKTTIVQKPKRSIRKRYTNRKFI